MNCKNSNYILLNLVDMMNLKEIGSLLVGIYLITSLLLGYKYYVAKGEVFQVSRLLVFRYIARFILLSALLFLIFYSLQVKQTQLSSWQNQQVNLFAISSNSSRIVWNQLQEKVSELPKNSNYELILYFPNERRWKQLIPSTNQDSFLLLLQKNTSVGLQFNKKIWSETIPQIPSVDELLHFQKVKNKWELAGEDHSENSLFSNSELNNWLTNSYVKYYLVILILLLFFIDSVFTAKAIKI